MPLKILKREIEIERTVGYSYQQILARAETLVPGVGRDSIEVLLRDAHVVPVRTDIQTDRVIVECALSCQAVYRQGQETSLRGISARTMVNQSVEIPGAQPGMFARVLPAVEQVSARYENGHMIFQVGLALQLWVLQLEPVEIIDELEGGEGAETLFEELCLTKLAAEAHEEKLLSAKVELPNALDARASLMDWGVVTLDSSQADLGGVRVKGSVMVESLIASGVEGKPGVVVRYPIEFDQLIELPEWLAAGAKVSAGLRGIRTQVNQNGDGEGELEIQAELRFDVASNLRECARALTDAYATAGSAIETQMQRFTACSDVAYTESTELIRDAVMLGENMSAGSVIALRVQPNIAEISAENGRSRIRGLLDLQVLYMPSGGDRAATAQAESEFSIEVPQMLEDTSAVQISVSSAEANALMGDRLETKIALRVHCETRRQAEYAAVSGVEGGGAVCRKPGYVVYWPTPGESKWSIGKRFGIGAVQVEQAAENKPIAAGQPIVLRI